MSAPNRPDLKPSNLLANASLYPNPFTRETRLHYSLPKPSLVSVELYSLTGVKLGQTDVEHQPPGQYQFSFGKDIANHATGMFIIKLQINEEFRIFKAIRK